MPSCSLKKPWYGGGGVKQNLASQGPSGIEARGWGGVGVLPRPGAACEKAPGWGWPGGRQHTQNDEE